MAFELKENAQYDFDEIQNMYPFEKTIFLDMLIAKREKEKEKNKNS